jgi:hypothetical protein
MVMSAIYLVLRFVKEDVGKGTALKRRGKGVREKRFMSAPWKTFVCIQWILAGKT